MGRRLLKRSRSHRSDCGDGEQHQIPCSVQFFFLILLIKKIYKQPDSHFYGLLFPSHCFSSVPTPRQGQRGRGVNFHFSSKLITQGESSTVQSESHGTETSSMQVLFRNLETVLQLTRPLTSLFSSAAFCSSFKSLLKNLLSVQPLS